MKLESHPLDLELMNMPLARLEQLVIERGLERYGSSVEGKRRLCEVLGISLSTLYNKIRKYGIGCEN